MQYCLDFSHPKSPPYPPVEPVKSPEPTPHVRIERNTVAEICKLLNRFDVVSPLNRALDVIEATLFNNCYADGEERYMAQIKDLPRSFLDDIVKIFGELTVHFVVNGDFNDVLGPVYMDHTSQNQKSRGGQFFTPWNICVMMAQLVAPDQAPTIDNRIKINEPCIGSGAMLLAYKHVIAQKYGRECLRYVDFSGQDIDPTCVKMAKIQMAMTNDSFMRDFYLCEMWKHDHLSDRDDSESGASDAPG